MNVLTDLITDNKGVLIVAVFTVVMASLISAVPAVYASEPFIGEIRWFAGNFAPIGWAQCDGQLLAISGNDALFSLFGTIYGGDGRTTFGIPDMRGRIPIHMGTGPGLSPHNIGHKSGTETVSVTVPELPSHSHVLGNSINQQLKAAYPGEIPSSIAGKSLGITAARLYSSQMPTAIMHSDSISVHIGDQPQNSGIGFSSTTTALTQDSGGGQSHSNMAPSLAIKCITALTGVFPPRN